MKTKMDIIADKLNNPTMQAVLGTGVIAGFSKLSSYVAATYMSGAQDNEKVAVLNKEAHLETVPTPDTGSQGYL